MRVRPLKVLSFVYWELDIFFKIFSIGGSVEWKVMTALGVAQMCAAIALCGCLELFLGHRESNLGSYWKVGVVALAVAIYGANYRALITKQKWSQFKAEFESYSRFARVTGCVLVVAGVIAAIVGVLVVLSAVRQLPIKT
jgi:hypothetical protein